VPRGASCAPTLDARCDKHTVEHQGDAAHGGGRVSVRSLPQPRALSSRRWQDRLFCPSHTYQQPVLCITTSVDTVVGCNKNGPTNHRGWVRYRVATFAAYTTSGLVSMLEGLQRI